MLSDFHSDVENFKQFSNKDATKLVKYFRIKNTSADKYSLIYILY